MPTPSLTYAFLHAPVPHPSISRPALTLAPIRSPIPPIPLHAPRRALSVKAPRPTIRSAADSPNSAAPVPEPEPAKTPAEDPDVVRATAALSSSTPALLALFLPSFLLLARGLLRALTARPPPLPSWTMLLLSFTLIVPDFASSAAIQLGNVKTAWEAASKRKPLLRRVKPVLQQYTSLILAFLSVAFLAFYTTGAVVFNGPAAQTAITTAASSTSLLAKITTFLASITLPQQTTVIIASAIAVVASQMAFHYLAKIAVNDDGSIQEVTTKSRNGLLLADTTALALLVLYALAPVAWAKNICAAAFLGMVVLYFGVKKFLYFLAKFALS